MAGKDAIAIVGAGIVGRGWAIAFARAGHEVRLHDDDRTAGEAAIAAISDMAADLVRFDLLDGQSATDVVARIRACRDLGQALDGARYVQECTPEPVETKTAVFATLDAAADPDAVIASSSTAILPSRFTAEVAGRHRCLVAHPINPPTWFRRSRSSRPPGPTRRRWPAPRR